MFEQIQFHNIFNFLFVQKGFNFVLKELLNPFMLVSTSETTLEYFCPKGFNQSIHAFFDLKNYFKIFLSRRAACFDSRKYFRIFLSGRVCSIHSCLFCPQKVFQNVFVQEGLLNPLMLVLSTETILEYFCQEGFAHQSLKKFQLLKISI